MQLPNTTNHKFYVRCSIHIGKFDQEFLYEAASTTWKLTFLTIFFYPSSLELFATETIKFNLKIFILPPFLQNVLIFAKYSQWLITTPETPFRPEYSYCIDLDLHWTEKIQVNWTGHWDLLQINTPVTDERLVKIKPKKCGRYVNDEYAVSE